MLQNKKKLSLKSIKLCFQYSKGTFIFFTASESDNDSTFIPDEEVSETESNEPENMELSGKYT